MIDFLALSDKALDGLPLTRPECLAVLQSPDDRLLEVLHAAFRVRDCGLGSPLRRIAQVECFPS